MLLDGNSIGEGILREKNEKNYGFLKRVKNKEEKFFLRIMNGKGGEIMNDKICDCYRTRMERYYIYNEFTGEPIRKEREIGICNGTMECEPCKCGGDRKKCDFYDEVRNER